MRLKIVFMVLVYGKTRFIDDWTQRHLSGVSSTDFGMILIWF